MRVRWNKVMMFNSNRIQAADKNTEGQKATVALKTGTEMVLQSIKTKNGHDNIVICCFIKAVLFYCIFVIS